MWSLFLIPWFSLFFLDRSAIRKYMPVALFATVINTILGEIAWTYNWWKFKETLFAWDKVIPLFTVYGVFLVGTIWIFVFTFRKFWIYMLVNLMTDLFYGFGLATWLNKLGIRSGGGNISPIQNLLLMLSIAIILYVYQLWQEGLIGGGNENKEELAEKEPVKTFKIRSRVKAK